MASSPIIFQQGPLILFGFSLVLGTLFFFNFSPVFDWISADYEPVFIEYSKNIFHPDHMARVMYWGESILLPIIAKLVGASKSKTAFFFFCGFIFLLLLPIFSYFALGRLKSLPKAFLFVFLLGISYLIDGGGGPDSLIILLMGVAVLSNSLPTTFFCVALSCLAHFSLTVITVAGLIPLIYFSPLINKRSYALKIISVLVIGLLIGRVLLELWFWRFDYLHTNGRIHYVLDAGLEFFENRYLKNIFQFWLTPKITFLIIFGIVVLYFGYLKRGLFCLAALISLMLAYIAMFFTVDGYRVFAVAISAPWIYLLLVFTQSLNSSKVVESTD
jgi:hypothetical protein